MGGQKIAENGDFFSGWQVCWLVIFTESAPKPIQSIICKPQVWIQRGSTTELSGMRTMEPMVRSMRGQKWGMRILIMELLWRDGRERGSLMSTRNMARFEGRRKEAWICFNITNKLNIWWPTSMQFLSWRRGPDTIWNKRKRKHYSIYKTM